MARFSLDDAGGGADYTEFKRLGLGSPPPVLEETVVDDGAEESTPPAPQPTVTKQAKKKLGKGPQPSDTQEKPVASGGESQAAADAAAPRAAPVTRKAASRALLAVISATGAKYQDTTAIGSGMIWDLLFGIPIPFALQYLLQVSHFPLGYVMQVAGEPGANKSAFLMDLCRMVFELGGASIILENETKISPNLPSSICGYPDEIGTQPVGIVSSSSVQEWQWNLTYLMDQMKKVMTKKSESNPKPPGRTYPVLYGLDSLSGKIEEKKKEKIDDQGSASVTYGIEANLNTQFFKKMAGDMVGWPFMFVFTNHLKKIPKEGVFQGHERQKPGGFHKEFQECWELELRAGKQDVVLNDRDSVALYSGITETSVKCFKNSMGVKNREITLALTWSYDLDSSGNPRQRTVWDWHTALVDILRSPAHDTAKSRIERAVGLVRCGPENNKRYYSKRLGLTESTSVSKQEFGRLIEQDEEIINDLRRLFAIQAIKPFQSGKDYNDLRMAAWEAGMKQWNKPVKATKHGD